jgi:4Fe-4S ferredoxin
MGSESECREAGKWTPVIDRNKCEAKADCVEVCPYDVFTIQTVTEADRKEMTLFGKVKLWVHKGKQAYIPDPMLCHACGLCVKACPETAIQLRPL